MYILSDEQSEPHIYESDRDSGIGIYICKYMYMSRKIDGTLPEGKSQVLCRCLKKHRRY